MRKIDIHYCAVWNYDPKAVSLAAELKESLAIDANLVAGDGGIFEVHADGQVIYSKQNTGRFPEPGEVTALLQ